MSPRLCRLCRAELFESEARPGEGVCWPCDKGYPFPPFHRSEKRPILWRTPGRLAKYLRARRLGLLP